MFHDEDSEDATYSDTLELDLSTVEPSLAGPKRPQDRVSLSNAATDFLAELRGASNGKETDHGGNGSRQTFPASDPPSSMAGQEDARTTASPPTSTATWPPRCQKKSAKVVLRRRGVRPGGRRRGHRRHHQLHQHLEPRRSCSAPGCWPATRVEKGLTSKPWVKTSLAPGSKVVMDYSSAPSLIEPLNALGFNLVGYGCTTCIGNSGPLPDEISAAIEEPGPDRVLGAVGQPQLRGPHPPRGAKTTTWPARRCAWPTRWPAAWTWTCYEEPLGQDADGNDVYLKDIWPSQAEIHAEIESAVESDMFRKSYGEVFEGDENWESLEIPEGDRYAWDDESTYVKRPPYFEGMEADAPEGFADIKGARILAKLGDSRDHRPHLARRRDQEGHARRQVPDGQRRRAAATSTPTARAAATTR